MLKRPFAHAMHSDETEHQCAKQLPGHCAKSLQDLLSKAGAFTPAALQQALGKQLWQLCQPVGFVDPTGHIVMLRVASSCAAMEVSLRKPEILQRLRRLEPFADVRDLRICVQIPQNP